MEEVILTKFLWINFLGLNESINESLTIFQKFDHLQLFTSSNLYQIQLAENKQNKIGICVTGVVLPSPFEDLNISKPHVSHAPTFQSEIWNIKN